MTAAAPPSFGQEHFGTVQLGHAERNRCLLKIATLLQRHPGGTLPDKLACPKDYKAMLRLANRPEVTHAAVLRPHQERTWARMRDLPGPNVLLLHDTTELDYSGLHSLAAELGPIGCGLGRGYLCHNSLAVDPQRREVLGLAGQLLHCREAVPPHEGVAAKRARESRESRLWTRAVAALGPLTPDKRCVDVCDRGADVFEFLAYEVEACRSFVVRSTHSRSIEVGHGQGRRTCLHAYARTLPEQGRRPLRIAERPGQPSRQTTVAVAFAAVRVVPPHVRRGEYVPRPLDLWVIRVWEPEPPAGVEPVEWILLSNVAVATVADAWERVDWYECRWLVEEFHKGQKTGCAIEDMQFTTAAALQPMIALLSVVAVTLLNLRECSRRPDAKERLATAVVDVEYVQVLSHWRYKEVRLHLSIHEFFQALARLGGHQNRKRDGHPGWLVLWRGWMKLQYILVGYQIRGQT
jgi:hypothetical protein